MFLRVPALIFLGSVIALPVSAGYAGRDLFIPVVGHSIRFDKRVFSTTLWLTNASESDVDAKLTFITTENGKPSLHVSHVRLHRGETRLFDEVDAGILGASQATGALHIESTGDVLASARIFSRMANEPLSHSVAAAFSGMPSQFAIGNGESATLHGVVSGDYRYKLFLVETIGEPLAVAVSIVGLDGGELRRHLEYLAGNEQKTIDIQDAFPDVHVSQAVIRLTGLNGNGRIIAGGAQIALGSQDGTLFEMSMETKPRFRVSTLEIVLYLLVTLVLGGALLVSRRSSS
jgi:hypothetical protein